MMKTPKTVPPLKRKGNRIAEILEETKIDIRILRNEFQKAGGARTRIDYLKNNPSVELRASEVAFLSAFFCLEPSKLWTNEQ